MIVTSIETDNPDTRTITVDEKTDTVRVVRHGRLHSVSPNHPAKIVGGERNIKDKVLPLTQYKHCFHVIRYYYYSHGRLRCANSESVDGDPGIVTKYTFEDGTGITEYAYFTRKGFQRLIRKDAKTHLGHSIQNIPAIEYNTGTKIWMKHGMFHRTDGPAIITGNWNELYYIDGVSTEELT